MRIATFLFLGFLAFESGSTAPLASASNSQLTGKYYRRILTGHKSTTKLSELSIFLTAMPKGGDLHNHYSGSIYVETYLDWITEYNYCIYRADNATLKTQIYRIETNASGLSTEAKALCITADQARQDNDFYRQLMKRWSDADFHNHFHEQPPPDKQFFDTFGYFGPANNGDYTKGLLWLKTTALVDNVQYIELMLKSGPKLTVSSTLSTMMDALRSTTNDTEIDRVLTIYYNTIIADSVANATITSYINTLDALANDINDANFTLRFQAYVTRSETPSRIFGSMYSSVIAVVRSQSIIGVNIVGPENGIVAMRDYTLHMKMFRFLKKRFPNVKLAMHAGELVLGLVPPDGLRFHIREAVEIAGASRIGHGIDIFYEHNAYELLNKMSKMKIAVEAIISSNSFILGIDNEEHPLLVYNAHNVPVVIATDDAGVSRSTLSNEYVMYCDRYRPTYTQLKASVYRSITYSFLSDADKQIQRSKLDAKFRDFEESIAKMASK